MSSAFTAMFAGLLLLGGGCAGTAQQGMIDVPEMGISFKSPPSSWRRSFSASAPLSLMSETDIPAYSAGWTRASASSILVYALDLTTALPVRQGETAPFASLKELNEYTVREWMTTSLGPACPDADLQVFGERDGLHGAEARYYEMKADVICKDSSAPQPLPPIRIMNYALRYGDIFFGIHYLSSIRDSESGQKTYIDLVSSIVLHGDPADSAAGKP